MKKAGKIGIILSRVVESHFNGHLSCAGGTGLSKPADRSGDSSGSGWRNGPGICPVQGKGSEDTGTAYRDQLQAGGRAAIGAAYVAKAKPDGYTLLFGNAGALLTTPLGAEGRLYLGRFCSCYCLPRAQSVDLSREGRQPL